MQEPFSIKQLATEKPRNSLHLTLSDETNFSVTIVSEETYE
jgi:hypothetical protein